LALVIVGGLSGAQSPSVYVDALASATHPTKAKMHDGSLAAPWFYADQPLQQAVFKRQEYCKRFFTKKA